MSLSNYRGSEPWIFLWHLRLSELRNVQPQEGHADLTPKWAWHTCAHIVTWEVDGPLLQPLTWHLYTPLMPPTFRQRSVMWMGMATSKVWETADEGPLVPVQSPQLQLQRLQVQLLRGQLGYGGGGYGNIFGWGWGRGHGGM